MPNDSTRNDTPRLEQALVKTEAEVDASLRAATAVSRAIKQAKLAASTGNLRELRPSFVTARQAVAALSAQLDQASESWDFDEEAYLSDGSFTRELLETAARANLRMFEQDERLYCYPALIRVVPNDRSVLIDRDRQRRLRPSVLVAQLQANQRRPPRFKPEAFLEGLLKAYNHLVDKRGKNAHVQGATVRLLDIYGLLTLLPGQAREYSRQEFARDIYLLDRSGVDATRDRQAVSFPGSSGTRAASDLIRVVTESGQEKTYYGIAFMAAQ